MAGRTERSFYAASRCVRELTPEQFDDVAVWRLRGAELQRRGILIFYTPWCKHCRHFKEAYEQCARRAAFADFWAFNCEKYADHAAKIRADMPRLVAEYPTVAAYRRGDPAELLLGPPTAARLEQFAKRVCTPDTPD